VLDIDPQIIRTRQSNAGVCLAKIPSEDKMSLIDPLGDRFGIDFLPVSMFFDSRKAWGSRLSGDGRAGGPVIVPVESQRAAQAVPRSSRSLR